MKRITTWRPDTCGCVLRLEWDDAAPLELRTHTPTVTPCEAHRAHSSHEAAYGAVLAENQTKNRAVAALVAHAPHLEPADIQAEFDEARRLSLHGHGLWGADRISAQLAVDDVVGAGVVTV